MSLVNGTLSPCSTVDQPLSFNRSLRSIRKKSEFTAVYASRPICVRLGPFKAYCSNAPAASFVRLGMVIPKKATRTAVKRNLVKRLIRESFRKNICCLPPTDIIISLKGSIHSLLRADIRNHVVRLFSLLSQKGMVR